MLAQEFKDQIIRNLQIYFPFVVRDAEAFIFTGAYEVIAKMNDGSSIMYDDIDHTIRSLPKDSRVMTEGQCRNEFGKRLRKILRDKRVSQKELADMVDVSEVQLSKYINGTNTPNFYIVDKIAKALDCSIDIFRYID